MDVPDTNTALVPSTSYSRIATMGDSAIGKVRELETKARELPQLAFVTEHLIHAGMYTRTVHLPAGAFITSALIKIATVLIVSGEIMVYVGEDEPLHLYGYNVLPGSAGRKIACLAITDIHMSMMFPTTATDAAECEAQFTDEVSLLPPLSDARSHKIVTTGE
jgi:hypothetical protein